MVAPEHSSVPEPASRGRHTRPFLESAALPSWALVGASLVVVSWMILTRRPLWTGALAWAVFLSLMTFLVFGLDKWRARREKRRVSETNLLLLGVLGGALGGLVGMWVWRHKSQRLRFKVILPLALFVHVVIVTAFAVHA